MQELGVVFTMAPTRMEQGPTIAVFDDTCGNLMQLFQAEQLAFGTTSCCAQQRMHRPWRLWP